MKNLRFLIYFLVALLVSCGDGEPYQPYVYNANPRYTWGFVEFFGAEYAGYNIPYNVLSVSLFSDSLEMDSTGNLSGTGQFLYLEDILLGQNDSILQEGTYTVSDLAKPFTVFPGKNDTVDNEIFPVGTRIAYYEKNVSKSTVKLITEGTFTVTRSMRNFKIDCDFKTADKRLLKGSFYGELPHFDESLAKQRSDRKRMFRYRKF